MKLSSEQAQLLVDQLADGASRSAIRAALEATPSGRSVTIALDVPLLEKLVDEVTDLLVSRGFDEKDQPIALGYMLEEIIDRVTPYDRPD